MDKRNMIALQHSYAQGHDANLDPRNTVEFAAAGFRFGHSMIPEHLVTGRKQMLAQPLKNLTFKPAILRETLEKMEDNFRGMVVTPSEPIDAHFADSIHNMLFESEIPKSGVDLVAFNVQRGRDQGLARTLKISVLGILRIS